MARTFAPGTVFSGNHGEAAAFARQKVESGEWTREYAIEFTERVYRQTMLEQLAGIPQAESPEELPEHQALFTHPSKKKMAQRRKESQD